MYFRLNCAIIFVGILPDSLNCAIIFVGILPDSLNCAIIFVGILPDSLIRLLILIRTESFYGYLEEKFGEPWSWDSGNGKPRAQAIYTSFRRFEGLIAF